MKLLCDARNVSFSYKKNRQILSDISFSVREKEIIGVLGKNGSGKSTLLNVVAGFLCPQEGGVFVHDKNIQSFSLLERAKAVSYIQQKKLNIPNYYTTEDFVIEGRRPFRPFGVYAKEDYELLTETLNECDLLDFKGRLLSDLSGGEFQRCVFARAIMKQADLYLFDEPCSAMDIKHQKEFFRIANKVKDLKSSGILITIHDINLAVQNCDRIILLNGGRILYDGKASNIGADVISQAFEVEVSAEYRNGTKYFYY